MGGIECPADAPVKGEVPSEPYVNVWYGGR